jgi:hypothetical protein
MRSEVFTPSPFVRPKAGESSLTQERPHACHLLSGGLTAVACQPVVPPSLVIADARRARRLFDETVLEHLLDRAVQSAWTQLDLAVASFGDVQHDSVPVKRLVGQCDEDLENRWGHRALREQRLRHGNGNYIDMSIYWQVDTVDPGRPGLEHVQIGSNWRYSGQTAMAKIEDAILAQFFQELEKTEGFSKERVDDLRALFKAGKKLKATDFVKVLSEPPQEQLP